MSHEIELTNDNIVEHACEGIYAGGELRFYYITKDAVMDFPHVNGVSSNPAKTSVSFSDHAGNDFESAKSLGVSSSFAQSRKFDYVGDLDYYVIIPASTGQYNISITTVDFNPFSVKLYNESF